MKNKLYLIVFLVLLSLPILFSQVSAFCVISGYTMNSTGDIVISSDYLAYCQNAGNTRHIYNSTGGLFSWGGPFDTCDSYCGNVYINATNISDGIEGRCNAGYPLNAGNVPGWNNGTTKAYGNVTMYPPASIGCVGAISTYACGDAIVEDCIFNGNVDCSGTAGFGVTVPGVTIECLNYELSAAGAETMFTVLANNVIIQNCIITNVNYGIATAADYVTSTGNTFDTITTAAISVSGGNYFTSESDDINCREPTAADGIIADPGIGTNDGLSVIGDTITNCSVGASVIASDGPYFYNNIFGVITYPAINLLSTTNVNISDNRFNTNFEGVYGSRSTGIIQRNIFTSDSQLFGYGVFLEDGSSNVIWNNSFSGYYDAIKTDGETSLQVSKNRITQVTSPIPYAITLDNSDGIVINNVVTSPAKITLSLGLDCDTSTINFTGNNISTQAGGISAGTCTITGNTNRIMGSDVVFNIGGLSMLNLVDLTTSEATVDVLAYDIDLIDSALTGISLPSSNLTSIGIVYNMTSNGPFAFANINITYASAWPADENTLTLWKYNGTWTNISGSGVDTGSQFVYSGDVVSFSVFVPLGVKVAGANIDGGTCTILRLIIILMAVIIMALSLWFAWASYKSYEDGNFSMNELLSKFFVSMMGVFVGVALLITVADIIAGMCGV